MKELGGTDMITFRLAPISNARRALTYALCAIPVVLLYRAMTAPPPSREALLTKTGLVALAFASVWLVGRPSRFELDETTLRIVWPVRRRAIRREDVMGAQILTRNEFLREYGLGLRIGAGGLWGAFGLLKTARETFSMWISRTDRLVLVQLRGARALLVTPASPERFVEALAPLNTSRPSLANAFPVESVTHDRRDGHYTTGVFEASSVSVAQAREASRSVSRSLSPGDAPSASALRCSMTSLPEARRRYTILGVLADAVEDMRRHGYASQLTKRVA